MILPAVVSVVVLFSLFLAKKRLQKKQKKEPSSLKQGAYGKVPVHKHSVLSQVFHMDEMVAVIKHLFNRKQLMRNITTELPPSIWHHLDETSRSFALVIRVLPGPVLADAVCIFYLLLRALDTIEDETDLSKFADFCKAGESQLDAKVRLLKTFHTCLLPNSDFPSAQVFQSNIGFGAEQELLHAMDELVMCYRVLSIEAQAVISSVCQEMAQGMSEYVARDMSLGTRNVQDYDRYCHIVAGLVGRGLTDLFVNLHFEKASPKLSDNWNEMGLMLQRTNITRDFCEDFADKRLWWPQTVTERYGQDLSQLRNVECLNEMVRHALELVPNSLDYLQGIENPGIFAFCAVPQIMAVATLQECYGNPKVFTGVVKIRSGLGAKLLGALLQERNIDDSRTNFEFLVREMVKDIAMRAEISRDVDTLGVCNRILVQCKPNRGKPSRITGLHILMSYVMFYAGVVAFKYVGQV